MSFFNCCKSYEKQTKEAGTELDSQQLDSNGRHVLDDINIYKSPIMQHKGSVLLFSIIIIWSF